MTFKFENLDVWQLALDYIDVMYAIAAKLPYSEERNLKSQITRAATSIALNVAEGSTGQTDAEQARFLGLAIRSLIETVACQRIIARRGYMSDQSVLHNADRQAQVLAAKLHAFRKAIAPEQAWLREERADYITGEDDGLLALD